MSASCTHLRRKKNAENYCRAEEDKKRAIESCKQAGNKAASAQKQVKLMTEQHQSVMRARRAANEAKMVADDLRQELARSEKRLQIVEIVRTLPKCLTTPLTHLRRKANAENYCRAEEDKKRAVENCKQAEHEMGLLRLQLQVNEKRLDHIPSSIGVCSLITCHTTPTGGKSLKTREHGYIKDTVSNSKSSQRNVKHAPTLRTSVPSFRPSVIAYLIRSEILRQA